MKFITDKYKKIIRRHGTLTVELFIRKFLSILFSRIFGKEHFAKGGFFFYCPSQSDRYVYNEVWGENSLYSHHLMDAYMRNGVVVDVGAHKGYFSLYASQYAKKVVSIEPIENNFIFLKRHIWVNFLSKVKAENKALSTFTGSVSLNVSPVTDARHSFYNTEFVGEGVSQQVETTTVTDIMVKYSIDRIDLLKLDCEGCEYDLLFDSNLWIDKISSIALEIHEDSGIPYKKDRLISYLRERSFTVDVYGERTFGEFRVWMAFCYK